MWCLLKSSINCLQKYLKNFSKVKLNCFRPLKQLDRGKFLFFNTIVSAIKATIKCSKNKKSIKPLCFSFHTFHTEVWVTSQQHNSPVKPTPEKITKSFDCRLSGKSVLRCWMTSQCLFWRLLLSCVDRAFEILIIGIVKNYGLQLFNQLLLFI